LSISEDNKQLLLLLLAAFLCSLALASISWFRSYIYHVFEHSEYLAIHTTIEFASVVVSFAVATIGWYSYRQTHNKQTLVIGFTFFTVGLLDFAHTLSFPGMPPFITASHAEKALDFWIAGRLFGSISLLLAAFVRPDSDKGWINPPVLAVASLLTFGAVTAVIASFQNQLPEVLIPGRGVTPLKAALEYVVISLSLAAIVAYRQRKTLETRARFFLQVALVITVFSELSFTLFRSEFDSYDLLGHVFKITAFYYILQALYVAPLLKPYEELVEAKSDLEKAAEEYQLLYRQAERQSKILERSFLRMGEALATGYELTETLERIVQLAADTYFGHALLFLYNSRDDAATPVSQSGISISPESKPIRGTLGEILKKTGKPIYYNDLLASEELRDSYHFQQMRLLGMRSVLGAPIARENKFLGFLVIPSTVPEAFSSRDAELLHAFARQAAIAIESAQFFEENLRTTAFIRNVMSNIPAAVAVVSVPDFKFSEANNLYRQIPDIASDIIGMYLWDVFPGWKETDLPAIFNQVVETAQPLTFHEYEFKLTRRGTTYWNFTLTPNLHPETAEVESVTILAVDVTEEILLRKGLEEANRELQVLNIMSEEIIGEMELDKRLSTICQRATELVKGDGCVIAFFNEERQEISFPVLYNLPDRLSKMRVPLGEGIATAVITSRQPILIEDYGEYPQAIKAFIDAGLEGVGAVPLVFENKVLGVLEVVSLTPSRIFSQQDLKLLESVAGPAVVAIVNARLFEEQRRIAEILQKSLLPLQLTAPPQIEVGLAYSSATPGALVGGDFYDIFTLAEDTLGIVIGDVAGRGIETAALTAVVKSSIRAFASEHSSPASVISRTNRAISKQEAPFVTVFYGRLNLITGELHYGNAGHPPPVIYRPAEAGAINLHFGQPPLGVDENIQYSEFLAMLNARDKIAFYTDGLLEARATTGEMFGQERLVSLVERYSRLVPQELADAMVREVTDFASGRLRDDFAVMVMSFKGK
jgi:GAF domain-containing protein